MTGRDPDASPTRSSPPRAGRRTRVSPLPPPDEVFADWLLSVPHGEDLAAAARRQVELIDARGQAHPDLDCLRLLLVAVAGEGA